MAMTGYAQGRSQTIQLPRGGYMMAPQFSGYGGHDPYLNAANPYANGASQAGALGMGSRLPGGGYGIGSQLSGIGANAGILGAAAGYASAQQANKDLENELKTGFDARYQRNMDAVNGLSEQSLLDVNKIFDNKQNQLRRQFGGGGSANQSTVMASVLAQNESERAAALNRARDALTMRKVGLDADLSRDALMQRERVTNAYPDMATAANLAEKAGAAQAPPPPEYNPPPMMPGYEQQSPVGPSFADFEMTPAQKKQANRMQSYADSKEKKARIYGNRTVAASAAPQPAPVRPLPVMNSQGGYGIPYGSYGIPAPVAPARVSPAGAAFSAAIEQSRRARTPAPAPTYRIVNGRVVNPFTRNVGPSGYVAR